MRKKIICVVILCYFMIGCFSVNVPKIAHAADINSNLVAHWKFDGDISESVNSFTTENGAKPVKFIEGVHGKAVYFNGKDNYLICEAADELNLGNSETENNDNFTISFWANMYDLNGDGDHFILDKGNESGWDDNGDHYYQNPYRIYVSSSNYVYLHLSNEYKNLVPESDIETYGSTDLCNKSTEGQEWKLITLTYDGSTIKRYEDNQLVDQKKYSDGIAFNNEQLYIGINGDTYENLLKGALDDLRLYTRTLSYDDVEALYKAGVKANKKLIEPKKQLVAYYAFDGDLKDDSSFKNDAEKVAVGGTTKYVIGKNGKAITMSKGNYIRIPAADQLNFDYDFTISLWMKSTSSKDQTAPILYHLNPSIGGDNENSCSYRISLSEWGTHENATYEMGTLGFDNSSWCENYSASISTSEYQSDGGKKSSDWNHVTFTYTYDTEEDAGLFKVYINGVLKEKTDDLSVPNIVNASGDLYIGYDNDTFFTGAIDELKIYNKCLSATDVKNEYKRVDTISLTKSNLGKISKVSKGKSVTCPNITLKDIDGKKTKSLKPSDSNVKFKSSNKKIFTVTDKGVIKGVKAGTAKLTITYGGLSATYKITVK